MLYNILWIQLVEIRGKNVLVEVVDSSSVIFFLPLSFSASVCTVRFITILQMLNITAFLVFQVVTLSVYAYFLAALIGAQMIPLSEESGPKKPDDVDLYFPVITVLEVSTVHICSTKNKPTI
jgi:hypothetical protein